MAYIRGPYAQHSSLPSPTVTTISNARSISFETKRYEIDTYGNFPGMDPTAQRVMLAVSWGAPDLMKFISDNEMDKRRREILAALDPLVDEGVIEVQRVIVERDRAGSAREQVDFLNKLTGTSATVTRP